MFTGCSANKNRNRKNHCRYRTVNVSQLLRFYGKPRPSSTVIAILSIVILGQSMNLPRQPQQGSAWHKFLWWHSPYSHTQSAKRVETNLWGGPGGWLLYLRLMKRQVKKNDVQAIFEVVHNASFYRHSQYVFWSTKIARKKPSSCCHLRRTTSLSEFIDTDCIARWFLQLDYGWIEGRKVATKEEPVTVCAQVTELAKQLLVKKC